MTEEENRLQSDQMDPAGWKHWKHWGPYLSERAWGTVREDYSADGSAWDYFPHEHANARAYRWNEDGLLGICDQQQFLCFALTLWNGRDPILKERPFGLTGNQGNHGEDVKEYYFFLDSTPTHSYMKALYKYPQGEFPYADLVAENHRRGKLDPEYELLDTGVFKENRYFDVTVEYAKADPEDILIRITASNRGPDAAPLQIAPTLWFRNTWSWLPNTPRPRISIASATPSANGHTQQALQADHAVLQTRYLLCESVSDGPEFLFTENDTNHELLFPPDGRNASPFVKDGIHNAIVHGRRECVNPGHDGTKAAALYRLTIPAGESRSIRLRLTPSPPQDAIGDSFDTLFNQRIQEADAFYATVIPDKLSDDEKNIQRQALAGMLWSKQYYHYNLWRWLKGDPTMPTPPPERLSGRNSDWIHVDSSRVLSMPDTWEYPWFAAWDLAFHCIPLALVDPEFAKDQLVLLLREWFMHPNGQLPAYEWAFSDVNPPVHAWAAMRIYQIEKHRSGKGDISFLERVFHKLLINFTWWVNRKDAAGKNIFQGGFLGLDNIGVFDRSKPLPTGGYIDQSDGTSWMAMYCLNLLAIALELARQDSTYEDVATKFMEHFFYIAHAMNGRGSTSEYAGVDLWDDEDGFYYDVLHLPNDTLFPLRVRSMVGLIPMLAVETLDPDLLEKLPDFKRRLDWFVTHRPDLCEQVASFTEEGAAKRRLFSVVSPDRLRAMLSRALDTREFLAPTGLRALSRAHCDHPYHLTVNGTTYTIDYEPAESTTSLFGGNSNWRGPIWFPLNFLIIEALQKFDHYYGPDFKVEFPTGSGDEMTLWEVSVELSRRLISTFVRDGNGRRPVYGGTEIFQTDPHWRDLITFSEYFNGDDGAGLGASHQTGWTGLVAKLIQQSGE